MNARGHIPLPHWAPNPLNSGLAWALAILAVFGACRCPAASPAMQLDFDTRPDPELQRNLEAIDSKLREARGMAAADTAIGLLDLKTGKVAMLNPDRIEYAASVPKIGILLAWFELRPETVTQLKPETRRELGLMIKASSNEAATRFSRELGLTNIQAVIEKHGFYDAGRGGGIWVGKHYGRGAERIADPLGGHSHAATVRQLLRFYLLLYQEKLISPEASRLMREIFASPDIPHDMHKFVKGLEGRDVSILRKWGSWQDYLHDSALITGPGREYILVALTHHSKGDDYLENLAREVDVLMMRLSFSNRPRSARPDDQHNQAHRGE